MAANSNLCVIIVARSDEDGFAAVKSVGRAFPGARVAVLEETAHGTPRLEGLCESLGICYRAEAPPEGCRLDLRLESVAAETFHRKRSAGRLVVCDADVQLSPALLKRLCSARSVESYDGLLLVPSAAAWRKRY